MKPRRTTAQFVAKATIRHSGVYSYSKVDYQSNLILVTITCSSHGDFNQRPVDHMQGKGCKSCGYEGLGDKIRLPWIDVKTRILKIHGERYTYKSSTYKAMHKDITISCYRHGEFKMTPSNHLKGSGCSDCAVEEHPFTTMLTDSIAERNKPKLITIPTDLYILHLGEDIYKIGISKCVDSRICDLNRYSPYTFTKLFTYPTNRYQAFKLEQELHSVFKELRFRSPVEFSGHTELFTLNLEHIDFIREFLKEEYGDDIRV